MFTCGSESEETVWFSKKFTWVNIGISSVSFAIWLVYFKGIEILSPIAFPIEFPIAFLPSPILLLSAILTILFIHLDCLCCCCSCTPGEVVSVYSPTTGYGYTLEDGEWNEDMEMVMKRHEWNPDAGTWLTFGTPDV